MKNFYLNNRTEIIVSAATLIGLYGFFKSINAIPSYAYSQSLIQAQFFVVASISLYILAFIYGVSKRGEK